MDSLFQVWLWGSCKLGYIKKYNIQRDESMKIARESLEEAFTPQLKSMLSAKLKEDEFDDEDKVEEVEEFNESKTKKK